MDKNTTYRTKRPNTIFNYTQKKNRGLPLKLNGHICLFFSIRQMPAFSVMFEPQSQEAVVHWAYEKRGHPASRLWHFEWPHLQQTEIQNQTSNCYTRDNKEITNTKRYIYTLHRAYAFKNQEKVKDIKIIVEENKEGELSLLVYERERKPKAVWLKNEGNHSLFIVNLNQIPRNTPWHVDYLNRGIIGGTVLGIYILNHEYNQVLAWVKYANDTGRRYWDSDSLFIGDQVSCLHFLEEYPLHLQTAARVGNDRV